MTEPTPSNPEFGIDTFGETTADENGRLLHHAQVIRDVIEEGVLADQLGLDFIGIGEHHRADFAISSPDMLLAALASRTSNIRLGTAVTVLSSDDPLRVYERFATLDAISHGRAEVVVGRGAFKESFTLFGFDFTDHDALFSDKLDIFALARTGGSVTWAGGTRPPLDAHPIYPELERAELPVWIASAGTPASVIRAAGYRMPLMLAIIAGDPLRYEEVIGPYRSAAQDVGASNLRVGIHMPGYVAATEQRAIEVFWPYYDHVANTVGREQNWTILNREQFEVECRSEGGFLVGTPESVAPKIARAITGLGASRFAFKYGNGTQSHQERMDCISLFATDVVPRVREFVDGSSPSQ